MKQQSRGGSGPTAKKVAAIKSLGKKNAPNTKQFIRDAKSATKVSKAIKKATTPKPSKKIGGR